MTSLSATLSTLQPVTCITSLKRVTAAVMHREYRGLCGDAHDLASCPAVHIGTGYLKLTIWS